MRSSQQHNDGDHDDGSRITFNDPRDAHDPSQQVEVQRPGQPNDDSADQRHDWREVRGDAAHPSLRHDSGGGVDSSSLLIEHRAQKRLDCGWV